MRCWAPLLLFGLATATVWPAPATARTRLLFFDPDANQERLLNITELFNTYLEARKADVVFEPVQAHAAFDQRLRETDAKFAIVTSSYLKETKTGALGPLLVPQYEGSVYYHKLLVDLGGGPALQLDGKAIAATISDDQAAATLALLKEQGASVNQAIIISVSKDVDGLLALTFGQADAALVTEASISVLKRINPTQAARLRVLAKTGDILRSPLCEIGHHVDGADREVIMETINGLQGDTRGQNLMKVLSIAKWVPYTAGMLK